MYDTPADDEGLLHEFRAIELTQDEARRLEAGCTCGWRGSVFVAEEAGYAGARDEHGAHVLQLEEEIEPPS